LKITFQKFYRVTGSSTQHKGVTPDIKFPTALSPEQFGESSSPSALPWDEIKGTLYQKTPMVNDKVLNNLSKAYQDRLKSDAALQRFVIETEETTRSYKETKVSLNEATRKKEIEEAEKKKAANNNLDTKIVGKEGTPVDLMDMEDEYLREGLFVLSDLITTKLG
jgi:carboxyl-terminal processing protease